MVWVRSEYAGELAVVSAWLAALVPWNVTYATPEGVGTVLRIRFPFFEVTYLADLAVDGQRFTLLAISDAVAQQAGEFVYTAYLTWAAGAVLVAAALLLSFVYYAREERVENGPVDPVRLMGGLLVAAGAVLAVATYLLATTGLPGIPIPVGTVLILVLGVVLLRAERVGDGESTA